MWVDDGDLYNFVEWEDEEPVNIREWLKEEEREMKLYYVRNGQLESKDVDVDFFEKNTTLGGLLTPKEVDMASCSDLTVEQLIRFPYLTSNMMATDTKDYDETDWYETENIQIHGEICKELTETYEKKNADYGNSFEISLDKHGLIAGIVRMDDKMSRLISLNSKKEQHVMDESLRDTLMDLANYAIMSVMWLDEQ